MKLKNTILAIALLAGFGTAHADFTVSGASITFPDRNISATKSFLPFLTVYKKALAACKTSQAYECDAIFATLAATLYKDITGLIAPVVSTGVKTTPQTAGELAIIAGLIDNFIGSDAYTVAIRNALSAEANSFLLNKRAVLNIPSKATTDALAAFATIIEPKTGWLKASPELDLLTKLLPVTLQVITRQ